MRRGTPSKTRLLLALALAIPPLAAAAFVLSTKVGGAGGDSRPILSLPSGYRYEVLATSGETEVTSIEDGTVYRMPEALDANVVVPAPGGGLWLLSLYELGQSRSDAAGRARAELATSDDGDSDGWGSVSRLALGDDGQSVEAAALITTGLHRVCAAALTPWGTVLANEEFPMSADPSRRSGWVWEIDPVTGAATKLTGLGRMSHEQEALAADGAWYLTDDGGDPRFVYRFVPDSASDLRTGDLYGLEFDRATGAGEWIGPLDPRDPHGDMVSRGIEPGASGFVKAEGIVASPDGRSLVLSESARGSSAGRVWQFTDLTPEGLTGRVLVEGDFGRLSRPDIHAS